MSISIYEYLSILKTQETAKGEVKRETTGGDYLAILETVRSTIAEQHSAELSAALDDVAAVRTLKILILKYVSENINGLEFDRDTIVDRIYQDMAGLGILTRFLHDSSVEEININGYDTIEIIRSGNTEYLSGEDAFPSPEAALDIVKRMVRMGGMLLDAQTPRVDSYMGSGPRISYVQLPP